MNEGQTKSDLERQKAIFLPRYARPATVHKDQLPTRVLPRQRNCLAMTWDRAHELKGASGSFSEYTSNFIIFFPSHMDGVCSCVRACMCSCI